MEILGDVIYFQGQVVGMVTVRAGTLRSKFEEWVDEAHDTYQKNDELEKTLESIRDLVKKEDDE